MWSVLTREWVLHDSRIGGEGFEGRNLLTMMEESMRGIPVPHMSLKNGARSMEDFGLPKEEKKRKSSPSVDKKRRDKYMAEMNAMREEGEWENFRAGHLVALFAACHQHLYGVMPSEAESSKDFALAMFAANRMLKADFQGDSTKMVEFIRWSWNRESGREKWRRNNSNGGGRLGWRMQFSSSLMSDYKVDAVRKGSSR